jgi:protein-tyrosine phosphatase
MVASGSAERNLTASCGAYRRRMTVLAMQPERFWSLAGCSNFRDLGGHRTATGATLRWRKLFRSDSLTSATTEDRRSLRALGLATVLDLRSDAEVALGGGYRDDGVTVHHVPFPDLLDPATDWSAWNDSRYVADRYFSLCESAHDSIMEALAILTDPAAYPAVIHCSLGKDRTGVLVALLLRALGVPTHETVDEYALSRVGARRAVERLQAQLGTDAADLDPYLSAMLHAEPDTMRRFLRRVHDDFDGVTGYLRRLGILSSVEHLRAALVQ